MEKVIKNPERRSEARLTQSSPISICDAGGCSRMAGLLFNRSETGIYFELDSMLEADSQVYIGLQRATPDAAIEYSFRLARIVWCRKLEEGAPYEYGCGAILVSEYDAEGREVKDKRRHPRFRFQKQVRIADVATTFSGLAGDISASGIFVKSAKQPRAGQTFTLGIPDKAGKTVAVQAKVVWSSAVGFGLKFIR